MTFLSTGQDQASFGESYKDFKTDDGHSKSVFVSESPIMKMTNEKIDLLSGSSSPVLILGSEGSGRSQTAYEIFHRKKSLHSKNFIKLICYGVNSTNIEEDLFNEENTSLLQIGPENTLYIKGVEVWPSDLQRKFLSYISHDKNRKKLPRLICSAEDSLSQKVKEGQFSQELFKVLSQNLLVLPSLSERLEEIPLLIDVFNKQNGFNGHFTEEAIRLLKSYHWEKNIKELKDLCFHIFILYSDKDFITEEDLSVFKNKKVFGCSFEYDPHLSLEDIINQYIQMSLDHFQSKKESAKALGISVKTIYNKIKSGSIIFASK